MKDHTTSLEEALKLIAPVLLVFPTVFTMLGTSPLFREHAHLSPPELSLLQNFYFSITMNMSDMTVEARLKRAQDELLKVIQSGEPGAEESSIYGQVRRLITDGIVKNKDVLKLNPTFPIVSTGLLPAMPSNLVGMPI